MEFRWVSLHVGNLERSLGFYHEVLGLPIGRRIEGDHRIIFLGREGGPMVELIEEGAVVPGAGKGISFGFGVPDLEGFMAAIRERTDAPVTGPISPNPQTTFYFVTDPDGYQVQLLRQ